jgi:hypothetical protein
MSLTTTSGSFPAAQKPMTTGMTVAHMALGIIPYVVLAAAIGLLGAGFVHLRHERQHPAAADTACRE